MMISDSSSLYIGLRKVTDDMKSKNRTDRTGIVAAEGTHNAPSFLAQLKLLLNWSSKWVASNNHFLSTKEMQMNFHNDIYDKTKYSRIICTIVYQMDG
jgi:hypothetical protein